jgi:hypothetical protein
VSCFISGSEVCTASSSCCKGGVVLKEESKGQRVVGERDVSVEQREGELVKGC